MVKTRSDESTGAQAANGGGLLRLGAEAAVVVAVVAALMSLPRIPQPPEYHSYAGDERRLWGVPHGANVLSSLPLSLPGLRGLWELWHAARRGTARTNMAGAEAAAWAAAFAGMAAVGPCSARYHLAPSHATLVWDRLGIAASFCPVLAALLVQRRCRGAAAAAAALPLLLAGGVGSVLYWRASELAGRGDLRPYILAQGGSALASLYLLLAYPAPPGRSSGALLGALGLYAAAMAAEAADPALFRLTRQRLSGHTLKHLVVAACECCVVAHMQQALRR